MQKKSILLKSALGLLLIPILWTTSCKNNTSYPRIPYVDFTSEISAIADQGGPDVKQFRELRNKHGRFFDLWLLEILDFTRFGPAGDTLLAEKLSEFLELNKTVLKVVNNRMKAYADLQDDISRAFGRLAEETGTIQKPVLYSYFSQFSNYNTFVDTTQGKTVLAFSADMFMNDTFALYREIELPEFYNRYNATGQIPAMLVWNYLKAKYETPGTPENMLSEAVFNGKIWYTMAQVFGEEEIWKQFGYSQKEWEQMVREEGQIWRHYLNEQALFSSDFNHYKRYFTYGNRTFGSGIPEDCPPLIGNFTGYRIISAYMEKKGISVSELWKTRDAGEILRESGYNPLK